MPKRITILMGNPDKEGTLTNELADVYEREAKAAGHEVRRTNVGDLSFDPILHKGYRIIQDLEPDLTRLQDDIRWCDHFVLAYPLWWSGAPALLKGLIDRMWLPAFAFRFHKTDPGWSKLLKGKTARVIVLSKTPPWAIWFLFGDFTNEIARATLAFSGFRVRTTAIGNSENLSEAAKARLKARIGRLARAGR